MSEPKLSEKMTATRASGHKVVHPMTWIRNGSGLWLPEAHDEVTHRLQRQPAGWYRFGRDVLVNVVANLVAAAVLYLFAKGSGYIKGNPAVTSAAVAVVTGTLVFSLALLLARLDLIDIGEGLFPMLLLFAVAVAGRAVNVALNPTIGGRRVFTAVMGLTLAGYPLVLQLARRSYFP
jgi:hypothetical protein